jgi:primary-amine oxidase
MMTTRAHLRPWGRAGVALFASALALSGLSVAPLAGASGRDEGPLDPLSADEILQTIQVIEASNRYPAGAFFPAIRLKEPPKSELLAWDPGEPFRREAFANVYERATNRLFEAVVDLRTGKLTSWVERPGAQPAVFISEYADLDAVVRADPRWRKAIRDRNLRPADVYIDGWAPGSVALPGGTGGKRLMRALSFFSGDLPNPYDRPIEGLVATVDMNAMTVIDVTDTGVKPVNTTLSGSADTTRPGLKPLSVVQPEGPSFTLNGNLVTWMGWQFRVGYNPREGLVLHEIGFDDGDGVRPIIQRMALDEVYVPYALPDGNWVWRAALDFGEYNLGQYSESLEAGIDVPTNAVFLDEAVPLDTGSSEPSFDVPHAIALYERDAGSLWDRTSPVTLERDARNARELVATASMVIGNYTYMVDYVFRLDGGIDVRAGATGTTLNRGVATNGADAAYGGTVYPNISAPNHQHFFNFRIDFDVDGTANRLVESNTKSVPSQFGNAWTTTDTVIGSEGFRDANPASSRHWAVQSATARNALGGPTAYEIEPDDVAQPYSSASFEPLKHAPFAQHTLWVTRYKDGELYAAGDYPNQAPPGEGLTKYVADHASVDGKDLVVWFTTAFTHHTRVEDYPVMSRETVGFSLLPDGFFDRNAALDAP